MAADGVKRKISAILSADVVGYSKLMESDEETTVRTMESYRETISSLIEQHNGHVVDSPGDNLLSEFPSVVESVQCAVEIQHIIKAKNAGLPVSRRMEFRIGIHLGDVIEEKERLYGDGINIAARIEGLADAGGICISDSAYLQIETKLALGYEDIGEHTVKNITKPVRVYRIPLESQGSIGAGIKQAANNKWRNIAFALAAVIIMVAGAIGIRSFVLKPSGFQKAAKQDSAINQSSEETESSSFNNPVVAVLPFDNLSNDTEQEYFSDSITEEIISRLSMHPFITVIARNSTFYYKNKNIKIRQIGKELGAAYIVEGSIRKAQNRIRITAQLIDAETEKHLWAKTYERENKDVFAMQDEISQQIVAAIGSQDVLFQAEEERIARKPTENFTAYDNILKATAIARDSNTKEALTESKVYINKAIELDPNFSMAHLNLGIVDFMLYVLGWDTRNQVFENALKEIKIAASLDNSDPLVHTWLANLYRWQGKYEQAIAEAERAIELNPNSDFSYHIMGVVLRDSGKPEEAIDYIKKSMRLNPHHFASYFTELAGALSLLGRHKEAIASLQKAIARNPQWMPSYNQISGAYRSLGQYDQAVEYANEGIAQNPDWALSYAMLAYAYLELWRMQSNEYPKALDLAFEAAQKAVTLRDNLFDAYLALGLSYLNKKQHDLAIAEGEKLIATAPNAAAAYAWYANNLNFAGLHDKAIEMAEKAYDLDPSYNVSIYEIAQAYRFIGMKEDAIKQRKKIATANLPFFESYRHHVALAILYAEIDSIEEAKAEAAKLLKLVPNFSVDVYGERIPYKDPALAERDMAALRKAGLK